MESNKTTDLILYEPPSSSESPGQEIPVTVTIHRRPFRFLRTLAAAVLTGIFLTVGGICTAHAMEDITLDRDDLPAFLLSTLSAGQVSPTEAVQEIPKSAAGRPDSPLDSLTPPETEPETEAPKIPDRLSSPLTYTNETPYTPDPDSPASQRAIPTLADLQAQYGSDAPFVLILSTHATESYRDHADSGYRTTDDSENVLRPASVIAEALEESGIGVIHCRTRFDEEDFTLAYYNASLEIRSVLRDHPSVKYIIDVHRDSVQAADGTYLAMESGDLAQLMFVVGTDHGGSGHTEWGSNFGLAARLYHALEAENPGIMRPVNLRSASFNQQYTCGSLILEIGSCAGSLENAVRSARLFAQAFADEIIG